MISTGLCVLMTTSEIITMTTVIEMIRELFFSYIVMENLRYMLYQYHPQTALYIGCRFAINYPGTEDGYHAGYQVKTNKNKKC